MPELLSGPNVADAAPAFILAFSPALDVANPLVPAQFVADAAPAFSPAFDVADPLIPARFLPSFGPKLCRILVVA